MLPVYYICPWTPPLSLFTFLHYSTYSTYPTFYGRINGTCDHPPNYQFQLKRIESFGKINIDTLSIKFSQDKNGNGEKSRDISESRVIFRLFCVIIIFEDVKINFID